MSNDQDNNDQGNNKKSLRLIFNTAVAIMLEREDGHILVQQRKGGYAAGTWMLPTGHVEGGETTQEAMARELAEETGLEVNATDLELMRVTHSVYGGEQDREELLTFFYYARDYYGTLENREPDKCAALKWVDPAKLPDPFMIHAAQAVRAFNQGEAPEVVNYPLNPRVNVLELTLRNRRGGSPLIHKPE